MMRIRHIDREAATFPLPPAMAQTGNCAAGAAFCWDADQIFVRDPASPENNFLGSVSAAISSDLLSFSRGSVASYIDGAGRLAKVGSGLPRLTHNPLTLLSSTTTLQIGRGFRLLTVSAGYTFAAGRIVRISDTTDLSRTMLAQVITHVGALLMVFVYRSSGSGSGSSWHVIEALGVLLEPQRTNLRTRSNELTSASWVAQAITMTTSSVIGPDGEPSMFLMTGTGSTARVQGNSSTGTADQTHTASIVCKRGNHDWVWMAVSPAVAQTNCVKAWFNLATGTVGSTFSTQGTGYTAVSRSIDDLGGGLYRCSMTYSTTSTAHYLAIAPVTGNNSTTRADVGSGAGVGTETYLGFAQIEVGAYPTSYIETTTTTVTRNGDNLSTPLTKLPWSATAGTVIEIGQPPQDFTTGGARVWSIDDGTGDNVIYTKAGTAGSKQRSASIIAATAEQLSVTPTTNDTSARYKAALAWASNDVQLVANGTTRGAADTSVTLPTGLTTLRYGRGPSGTDANFAAAPLEMLVYLPRRMTQAEMIARTA